MGIPTRIIINNDISILTSIVMLLEIGNSNHNNNSTNNNRSSNSNNSNNKNGGGRRNRAVQWRTVAPNRERQGVRGEGGEERGGGGTRSR